MGIDYAYLRRIIPVAADTDCLDFCLEEWVKEDKRYFFATYLSQLVYEACYSLYKNIAEAIIEQLGKDLIVVHDVDYMDSVINTYFAGFPDIKDAIVRKQLSEYISGGAQILFGKEYLGGCGAFPSYLDEELKKNKMLGDDETCIFVSGYTRNPKYAKKDCNTTYFLTNVFNIEVIDLLVDYRSWLKTDMLKNNRLHICFDRYYNDCYVDFYSENEKRKMWDKIISSEEERDKFIQSYIEYLIYDRNMECWELLLEYDNTAQFSFGDNIFTSRNEEQKDESEYDTDEYEDNNEDDYEDWRNPNEFL